MKRKLNCRQVDALIAFYNEGCLTEILTKYVKEHLESCPECRNKYCTDNQTEPKDDYYNRQYEVFRNNLSAYIDNELENSENIKIKKIAISNQQARKDLEDMYNFKKALNSVYERTQDDFKTDISKNIMKEFRTKQPTEPFYKLAAAFVVMILFLVTGLIKFLYF